MLLLHDGSNSQQSGPLLNIAQLLIFTCMVLSSNLLYMKLCACVSIIIIVPSSHSMSCGQWNFVNLTVLQTNILVGDHSHHTRLCSEFSLRLVNLVESHI